MRTGDKNDLIEWLAATLQQEMRLHGKQTFDAWAYSLVHIHKVELEFLTLMIFI